ncbi:hypothetical protein CH063_10178 [Colletotrichum higginsianum]|uniref:Uncharacterized protein n=1 Tax=Colletotrichum higginsianum (strain IMI 349063) TaxID=759273 RepID=H1VGG0_COLHI|nr:hypothetical protein CH063_10178 [Colletotrichum higginsianum]
MGGRPLVAELNSAFPLTSYKTDKVLVSEEAGAEAMEYMTWHWLNGQRSIPMLVFVWLGPLHASVMNPSIPHLPDGPIPPHPNAHQYSLGNFPLLPPPRLHVMRRWHLTRRSCIGLSCDSSISRTLDCFYISVRHDSFRTSRPVAPRLMWSEAPATNIPSHILFLTFKLWGSKTFAFLRCLNKSETPTLILHCGFLAY